MRKRILIATIVVFTNLAGFAQTPTLFVPDSIFGRSTVAGKVGIGTANPSDKLDVNGNIFLSGANRTISSGTGSLGFKIGTTQHMILSSGGNFSIGTTSVTQKLTVAGNMYLYGSNRDIMVGSGYSLSFKNGTTQQNMIITSAGKVGIGTTTPSEALDINGNINLYGANRFIGTNGMSSIFFKTDGTNRMTINEDGYVGIGTTTPNAPLDVNGHIRTNGQITARTLYISGVNNKSTIDAGDASLNFQTDGNDHMTITVDGKVGVGTTNPTKALEVNGDIAGNSITAKSYVNTSPEAISSADFRINNKNDKLRWAFGTANLEKEVDDRTGSDFFLYRYSTDNVGNLVYNEPSLAITRETNFWRIPGNVGIGTNALSQYKLAVNGKIIATEIVVKEFGTWPDYVFANNYNLRSLDEVESFIGENGHLPEVPSAKVVEETGVGVGEMNAVLLKKVEELTLYAIQQGKLIKALEEKLEKIEAAK